MSCSVTEVLEDHDLVDAVEELRSELAAQRIHDALAKQIGLLGEVGDERSLKSV
jgi:hypothetical protein